jgi:hypothetical protein
MVDVSMLLVVVVFAIPDNPTGRAVVEEQELPFLILISNPVSVINTGNTGESRAKV